MTSEGQVWATEQLHDIVKASGGAFEIVSLTEPTEEGQGLDIVLSVKCGSYPKQEGGIPFRVRERIRLTIPASFPLERPDAHFTHKRYGDFSHVQWGDSICLYQAPDTEWQPARGMFGYMARLDDWLRAGAAGALDPAGLPLHPPIAYSTSSFKVIPHENTPQPEPAFWAGYVEITQENDMIAHLGRWAEYGQPVPEGRLASAILLSGGMPHEYPASVLHLIFTLIERGISFALLQAIVLLGAARTPPGKEALFVLGAAMRGVAGAQPLQHLASWRINAAQTELLRNAVFASTPENPVDEHAFRNWAASANVEWCRVLEDRPEIVERRDSQSPSHYWTGREVAVLGCGAIGSTVAMMLARAGVRKLRLYDSGIVTPGVLIRQNFSSKQIGYAKVTSLKTRVQGANPKVEVITHPVNLLAYFRDGTAMAALLATDVIIDATASTSVATALELYFRKNPKKHPPILAMSLGHNADMAMMTMSLETAPGATLQADRRSKLAFAATRKGAPFLDEFWPTAPERRKIFQPEPGCSDPTFRGSFADVAGLTARMTNVAAAWLASPDQRVPRTFAINLSGVGAASELDTKAQPETVLRDGHNGYEVRVSREARASMLDWMRQSETTRGTRAETGGILFGEVDEFLKLAWIDEVSGPPPDSEASPQRFICGTEDVHAQHDQVQARSRGSSTFIGMWHTHPQGVPIPSPTDLGAIQGLLGADSTYLGRRFLMLIAGGTSRRPVVSASVFQRSDFVPGRRRRRRSVTSGSGTT